MPRVADYHYAAKKRLRLHDDNAGLKADRQQPGARRCVYFEGVRIFRDTYIFQNT